MIVCSFHYYLMLLGLLTAFCPCSTGGIFCQGPLLGAFRDIWQQWIETLFPCQCGRLFFLGQMMNLASSITIITNIRSFLEENKTCNLDPHDSTVEWTQPLLGAPKTLKLLDSKKLCKVSNWSWTQKLTNYPTLGLKNSQTALNSWTLKRHCPIVIIGLTAEEMCRVQYMHMQVLQGELHRICQSLNQEAKCW